MVGVFGSAPLSVIEARACRTRIGVCVNVSRTQPRATKAPTQRQSTISFGNSALHQSVNVKVLQESVILVAALSAGLLFAISGTAGER